MPTLSVYRHGSTMGAGNLNAKPPPRTAVTGWSGHAIRRNLLFLYGVDERLLEGLEGLALTLTLRDCPQDPEDWQRARDAFLVCLRRSGVVLVHWVTEWQRRGVPHLHLACYWDKAPEGHVILAHWLRIAAPFGVRASAQHSHPIYDVLGWNQYVSKHAARGLHHYQRNPASIPRAWLGKSTGRMWGRLGAWPSVDACKLDLDFKSYHRFRRLVRAWRLADARRVFPRPSGSIQVGKLVAVRSGITFKFVEGWRICGAGMINVRRVLSARRMLSCSDPRLSAVRGLSEWMPQHLALLAVGWLSTIDGAHVDSV